MQIDELVDVGRDALQRVVVQVQRGQVSQLEQLRRQGAHTSCYLQFLLWSLIRAIWAPAM